MNRITKLNRNRLAVIFFGIVMISALFLIVILSETKDPWLTKSAIIKIGGVNYDFEVADTDRKRFRGLSGRDLMGDFAGMYFVFDRSGINRMVMRDMRFPLDMVWLSGARVTDIVENIPLQSGRGEAELTIYSNTTSGDGVLELPAGFVSRTGMKVGEEVDIER